MRAQMGAFERKALMLAVGAGLRAAHARFYVGTVGGGEIWEAPHSPFRSFDRCKIHVSPQGYAWCATCHERPCGALGAVIMRLRQRARVWRDAAA